ncbi:2OG-Fe(II) oxygenase family protein [Aliidiomarina maris]|uniref:Uncharacterized protein (TIGR02466 family) n=1 Tax=Aliidiomarina maris TaxID=531312 RepID=A0A327X7I1_9GAMM|nr:putative 2OG-Fe(II) oxygenase [Aliidiomarina maris]RAK01843.1 uncharacterized protein (TIGR02466 family) [Aliidiomarina maris]RUO28652.1 hypothetical protein CWE07_02340 [Aliidiomarina maris]
MDTLTRLTQMAQRAKQSRQYEVALQLYTQAQQQFPQSYVAEHNLASMYGDMKRFDAAQSHARMALKKGSKAPQTWLVLARSLMGLQHYQAAADAYLNAIHLQPDNFDAQREWAQLTWMLTADIGSTMQHIDTALKRQLLPPLLLLRAQVYEYAGDLSAAQIILQRAVEQWPSAGPLLEAAIFNSIQLHDASRARVFTQSLLAHYPDTLQSLITASYAYAATGEAEQALQAANRASAIDPLSQQAIACQATALRLLYLQHGQQQHLDAYRALYDYDTLVTRTELDVPSGWSSLAAYIDDLAGALKSLHPFKTHPFGQSVRSGSQLPDILSYNQPVINAFEQAIAGPIARHLAQVGQGEHPLRRRNTGQWAIDGIWSVWLQSGGFHENHVHPHGWISSACYIQLPDGVDDADTKSGWLKLGEPMMPTEPELEVEHWVKPEVGHLVLFPSYMWHGTAPFSASQPRLSVALDIVPA